MNSPTSWLVEGQIKFRWFYMYIHVHVHVHVVTFRVKVPASIYYQRESWRHKAELADGSVALTEFQTELWNSTFTHSICHLDTKIKIITKIPCFSYNAFEGRS